MRTTLTFTAVDSVEAADFCTESVVTASPKGENQSPRRSLRHLFLSAVSSAVSRSRLNVLLEDFATSQKARLSNISLGMAVAQCLVTAKRSGGIRRVEILPAAQKVGFFQTQFFYAPWEFFASGIEVRLVHYPKKVPRTTFRKFFMRF
jgi:hypothetical protein